MLQEAPFPVDLARLVESMAYRPGWRFYLKNTDRGQGSEGLTFIVRSLGYDAYHPDRGETYGVLHYFIVPAASYNEESWKAWILQRLIEVETHEACEFLRFDENRVFAPHHGPGWDPYTVFIHGDDEAARTSFKGEVKG